MKELEIKSGRRIEISESCRIKPGVSKISDSKSLGAIRITGKNIEVDFRRFKLTSGKTDKNTFVGIGILVENAENVVIRNATVSGYKYNIVIKKSKRVLLTDCDTTGSYMKPIIGIKKYDNRDWLNIFEEKKWRAYGSGIALENCSDCRVQNCDSHDSVNGLWLIRSKNNYIVHNDFSHNSGWGIWMWESSYNTILFNNCDWCVRCEDPKRFSAGGDSAGIMLSNNNCHNLIAHNTMRYGGDGFFLSHHPTSDDNVIAFNDASHSPHNAFESNGAVRNQFIGNIASNSRHGFWIGGSTYNQVIGNIIENINEWGISLHTGHDNVISGNEIRRARRGIVFYDTRSGTNDCHDNIVIGNVIEECRNGIMLCNSYRMQITGNTFSKCDNALEIMQFSERHTISLNNFIGNKTLIELDGGKDILFSDNFCGAKTREEVLENVKAYKEEVLKELCIEHLRKSPVKLEKPPVLVSFENKSARKNRKFMWHTDLKKLVGHAETFFINLKASK
jgi:parallel beta-helix repeat protein